LARSPGVDGRRSAGQERSPSTGVPDAPAGKCPLGRCTGNGQSVA
jgi:hypothetical protein